MATTRQSLSIDMSLPIPSDTAIAGSYAKANKRAMAAAILTRHLQSRGAVLLMHDKPKNVWSLAKKLCLEKAEAHEGVHADVQMVQAFLQMEMGKDFPMIDMLSHGIGVHHGGLPDEVRHLVEWLMERDRLKVLVATTTLAQGVNFPVSSVVLAAHQYPYGKPMPPADFWNIAGRAGRVGQGQMGIIALAAGGKATPELLRAYIQAQVGDLNSALLQMVRAAGEGIDDLGKLVYKAPEWSSLLQYLVHSYTQMGRPKGFLSQVEQVLRGTLGFETLKQQDSALARKFLNSVLSYSAYIQQPRQPLGLVDSTGFSLQGIHAVLKHKGDLNQASWRVESLFANQDSTLRTMMGVLLKVPELRGHLEAVAGGKGYDGTRLALILKDWVKGESLVQIAERHFKETDPVAQMTKCGQDLFGKLVQHASWGMGALLAITGKDLPEKEFQRMSSLPSYLYYGVDSDDAVKLRLLGIPRSAASKLAKYLGPVAEETLPTTRKRLASLDQKSWKSALGESGSTYREVWRILEGYQ